MLIDTWSSVLAKSAQNIWLGFASFVPNLIIAIIILIIGWVVGSLIGRVIAQVIKAVKVDQALRSAGVEEVVRRGGFNLDVGRFVGGLVKWFIIVVALVAAFDVLGLTQVNLFLQEVVLLYLPRVIISVLILIVAVVIADVMQRVVVGAAKAAHIRSANFLGSVTRWAIWIFALLAVLVQLNIAAPFINTLFTGIIIAISLAFGLAFGLGGQDAAARVIEKIKSDISDRG
jgi:small-conductance mechanosensitive channel